MIEKNNSDDNSNASEYPDYDINADLGNLIFSLGVEFYNNRTNELAALNVRRIYADNSMSGEIAINTDMQTRMNDLEQQYEDFGVYGSKQAQYMAHKQTFYDHLAEYEFRNNLYGALMDEDTSTERMARSRLYLHEHIDRYDMDIGWHKVVSTLIDVDVTSIAGESVGKLHELIDHKQKYDRKSVMDTILAIDGGEEYIGITGDVQDISQHQTLIRAWIVAQRVAMPAIDGELESSLRGRNQEVLIDNLEETNMSDEKKAEVYEALARLL